MIHDKQMKYIKSENGLDYYIFTPTFFRQYYNKVEVWTAHRGSITHKLHMLLYYIRGGYHILYLMDGGNIAAYLVYAQAGNTVIKGSTDADIFTVFITTHPEYRRKGFASNLADTMLNGIGLNYRYAYKTIADGNEGSIKAAFANGYTELYPVRKSRIIKTISKASESSWKLYILK